MPHVAYKGGGPAMTDLIGGHIQARLISSTLAVPQASSGKVRALAVTSDQRLAQSPNVPTFAEAGFSDFKPQQWTGRFVPAKTPPTIVVRIHDEFAKALRAPDVAARLGDLKRGSRDEFAGRFLELPTPGKRHALKAHLRATHHSRVSPRRESKREAGVTRAHLPRGDG